MTYTIEETDEGVFVTNGGDVRVLLPGDAGTFIAQAYRHAVEEHGKLNATFLAWGVMLGGKCVKRAMILEAMEEFRKQAGTKS